MLYQAVQVGIFGDYCIEHAQTQAPSSESWLAFLRKNQEGTLKQRQAVVVYPAACLGTRIFLSRKSQQYLACASRRAAACQDSNRPCGTGPSSNPRLYFFCVVPGTCLFGPKSLNSLVLRRGPPTYILTQHPVGLCRVKVKVAINSWWHPKKALDLYTRLGQVLLPQLWLGLGLRFRFVIENRQSVPLLTSTRRSSDINSRHIISPPSDEPCQVDWWKFVLLNSKPKENKAATTQRKKGG
ncbi:hypothetical protein B0T22DRAFT_199307 [Podospora appendiculata]|uniref:Uncharacterized protein n=1 Tax=Podospora appendiculata TaxID=314037 RepID=A0AAE0X4G0_9PEZI|nr:hypothetical protein B0T22DRAFT_199307 [Podospora appendiculata]